MEKFPVRCWSAGKDRTQKRELSSRSAGECTTASRSDIHLKKEQCVMMNILKQYEDVLQLPPPNVNTKIKHIFIGLKMLLVVS